MKSYDKPTEHIKKQRHHFADKSPSSQSYGFYRSLVQMWELDYKESWAPKNWWFRTVVLEETLESPLESKEIKPVNPKGYQPEFSLKDWGWSWSANTLATWCEELTHWKGPWRWERSRAGEGDDREWDHCTASLTQWTWVWASFGRQWRTGKPSVLPCPWGGKEPDMTEWLNNNLYS